MATKNFSFTRFVPSALLVFAICGCQTTRSRSEIGPIGPGESAPPSSVVEAPPTKSEPKKVAVILGPGGAKAFAHVGVLRAFQQQRIPIAKIVGLEWGALIGGIYSTKAQSNDLDWKLYKMEQKGLPRPKGFFAKKLGEDSPKIMDDYIQETFLNEDLSSAKIPFSCPTRSLWTGAVAWQSRGLFKDVVKRCLPFPPVFKAQGNFLAGVSQASEAIEHLRNEGYNVIILVNVLGTALPVAQDSLPDNLNYVILWQEVRRSMDEAGRMNVEYVNIDTSAFPFSQFSSKKELIGLGEAAGQKAAMGLIQKYGF